ncbi:unnamed protein product [Caenorhabditis angaria]|uniref:Acyl_transf_3 domain-containing protein n=1 Tax=Caenorhabditis angaria TaxID=860376 RepID=A0A9P1IR65_9PELO|nr:unnamed protein product [Caenorhabditis angaria]
MREDIQCLRGLAIISVVLYHLFPNILPNGYLGVDIFFVISGFLMSQILSKQQENGQNKLMKIVDFYYRRMKRILPIYYFVIFLSTFLKIFYQADIWWPQNDEYSKYSLEFLTNHKILQDQTNYFNQYNIDVVTSRNLFLHCWSLCVEIQFYIIIPFIFIAINLFENVDFKKIIVIGIFFGSYSITFISVDPNFTFNFMPARIWQFSIGILAQMWLNELRSREKCAEEKSSIANSNTVIQLKIVMQSSIILVFLPIHINENIIRLIITLITGFIIFENNENIKYPYWLIYIGNASYVIYLVHWPIITMFSSNLSTFTVIYLIIITSIILHHIFEKILLQNGKITIVLVTAFILALNIGLHLTLKYNPPQKSYPIEYNSTIIENFDNLQKRINWMSPDCQSVKIPEFPKGFWFKFGRCKFANGNGKKKIMVIGNSYTVNLIQPIKEAFEGNYSTFEMVGITSNFGIFYNDEDDSELKLTLTRKYVKEVKPDILFIITRVSKQEKSRIFDHKTDDVILQYNDNIKFYENLVDKIYILGAFPVVTHNFIYQFIDKLELDVSRDKLHDFRISENDMEESIRFSKDRFNSIQCRKCEIMDMTKVFMRNSYFYGYDDVTLLSYFDNDLHFTKTGLDKIRPFFEEIVQNITLI